MYSLYNRACMPEVCSCVYLHRMWCRRRPESGVWRGHTWAPRHRRSWEEWRGHGWRTGHRSTGAKCPPRSSHIPAPQTLPKTGWRNPGTASKQSEAVYPRQEICVLVSGDLCTNRGYKQQMSQQADVRYSIVAVYYTSYHEVESNWVTSTLW